MLIGILSDSHGRHLAVRQAMQLFDEHGVEHVVHCGDVGGIPVFDEMLGRPLTFVFGNMDFPDTPLYAYLEAAGLKAVDGKSPVEYLIAEADKDRVRRVARALLARPAERLYGVRSAWARELAS